MKRPKIKTLHLIADNYATHKHQVVRNWLAKHPRFHMHFMPTSASWLNMVERFFRDITTERLRRFAIGPLKTFQKPGQHVPQMMRELARRPRQVLDYLKLTANSAGVVDSPG